MNEKITEKDLLDNFSSIEKLIKEWDELYTYPISPDSVKKEDITPLISEPTFIYDVHAST